MLRVSEQLNRGLGVHAERLGKVLPVLADKEWLAAGRLLRPARFRHGFSETQHAPPSPCPAWKRRGENRPALEHICVGQKVARG